MAKCETEFSKYQNFFIDFVVKKYYNMERFNLKHNGKSVVAPEPQRFLF